MRTIADILSDVKQVAKEAGSFIRGQRKHFDSSQVEMKGAHDYVSYVDKEAERMIVTSLSEIVPEAGFVTEEGTQRKIFSLSSHISNKAPQFPDLVSQLPTLTWVVDPLDGTTNFVHDMAPYCVAIALRTEEEILVGVVYEICADELFYTCKGMPSYLNGHEIHVGGAKEVNEAFINIGFPYDADFWTHRAQELTERLYGHCASIRNLGSAETELCYVACGRFDAYIESHLKPWDVTAGGLILLNAGGQVTDYSRGTKWWTGEELLATNGFIHEELLTKIGDIL